MSDLDDDLLALAGVSDSEEEAISTRKKRVHDESFDDSEGDDVDDNGDDDDDEDEGDDDELINPYPLENKYKDESDRDRLLGMDEITREELLFERSQEMERFNEKKFLQDRAKQQKQELSRTKNKKSQAKTRSSKRAKPTGTARGDKLSELRKQRERKKRRDDYSDDEEDEEDDDDLDEELDNLADAASDYEEGAVVWGTKSKKTRSYARAQYEDVNKLLVGRTFLHTYYFYNGFEDVILDCYGRINLGFDKKTRQPMYRMVKITDVQHIPEKKYKMPNFEGDLYLAVSQNKKQTKLFPVSAFSDSPITQGEFERYVKELEKNAEEIEYLEDVNEKHEQINGLVSKALTDHDINDMIHRKQSTSKTLNGYDAVYQKAALMDKLKIAQQQNNGAAVATLARQLKQLENLLIDSAHKSTGSKQLDSMSKVNERNRKLNVENIRKAEIKSSIIRKTASKDQGDPFQRLKTVTRVFYQDIINSENEKAKIDAQLNYKKLLDEKNAIEQKIATSSYRVLGVMDTMIRDIDFDFQVDF
ncbi:RNA polymerase-associated protein rtf1 [Yamadazyma tenuis]|uniref:RNA polymerase-associated protein rtf1 n=1 Tax=Candida tenuis TaxID=2315449 RepID=UPI00279D7293|nr:RNA polymerase-associated protein rtf1 [Yamadazyma tenuis]